MARGHKIYEWVFWFEDGHVMTQYTPEDPDMLKFEKLYDEALEYHNMVSPVERAGWFPISHNKAAYVNIKARYMECISKSPLPFHVVECHGMFPYIRRATDIKYGVHSGVIDVEYNLYLVGVGGKRIEHPQPDGKNLIEYKGGMYMMVDSSGNTRLDNTSFVLQPIPVDLPRQAKKVTQTVSEDCEDC